MASQPPPVPRRGLGTELLWPAFGQQDAIGQIGHVSLGGLAVVGGYAQQLKAFPLERGITVGVLRQQPSGMGSVLTDVRPSWPPDLGHHLLEPRKVIGIHLLKCVGIFRLAGRLVSFRSAQEFRAQVRFHPIRMSPGSTHGNVSKLRPEGQLLAARTGSSTATTAAPADDPGQRKPIPSPSD